MNKKVLFFGVLFITLVASGVVFLSGRTAEQMNATKSETAQPGVPPPSDGPIASRPGQTGQYVDYREGIIAATAGKKVLFFHASWCPQCRSIEDGIESQGVPGGLTIIKVDYDSHQDLRQKYGVTLQTTFVSIDNAGASTGKYVAYDEPTFEAVKRNFLNEHR